MLRRPAVVAPVFQAGRGAVPALEDAGLKNRRYNAWAIWKEQTMGGINPYIDQVKYTPATKKFKVTFVGEGKTVEVDPEKIPYGREGLPGSILDIATGAHMGLDHACGGVCACST